MPSSPVYVQCSMVYSYNTSLLVHFFQFGCVLASVHRAFCHKTGFSLIIHFTQVLRSSIGILHLPFVGFVLVPVVLDWSHTPCVLIQCRCTRTKHQCMVVSIHVANLMYCFRFTRWKSQPESGRGTRHCAHTTSSDSHHGYSHRCVQATWHWHKFEFYIIVDVLSSQSNFTYACYLVCQF